MSDLSIMRPIRQALQQPNSSKVTGVLIGLGLMAALFLGYTAPERGGESLLLALLPLAGLLLLNQPYLGALAMAVAIPLERLTVFGGGVTAIRLLGMAVVGVWVGKKLLYRESWRRVFSSGFVRVGALFVAFAVSSMAWAVFPEDVSGPVFTLFQMLLWSLLILDLVNSWERLVWLAKGIVVAALIAAALTVMDGLGGSGRAGRGVTGGINATGMMLVTVMPFGFYFLRAKVHRIWRLIGLSYIGLGALGAILTVSRASFLLLTVLLLAEYWYMSKAGRSFGWVVMITGIMVVAFIAFVPREAVLERYETIAPDAVQTIIPGEEGVVSDRGYYFRVGLAILQDHPLLGAGYENVRRLYLDYQYKVPGTDRILTVPPSPHNNYIAVLANVGVIGFVIWVSLLAIAVQNLAIALRRLGESRSSSKFLLVQAVAFSLFLQLGYGWFRPIENEKIFWLLLGLTVAVRNLVELQAGVLDGEPKNARQLSTVGLEP